MVIKIILLSTIISCIKSQQDLFSPHGFDEPSSRLLVKFIENDGFQWRLIDNNYYLIKGSVMIDFNDNFNLCSNPIDSNSCNSHNPLLSLNRIATELYYIQENNIQKFDHDFDRGRKKLMPEFGGNNNINLAIMYLLEKNMHN